jgi:integrase
MHGSLVAVLKMFRPDCHVTTRLPQYVKPDLYTPNDNDVEAIIRATQGTELFKAILLSAFGSLRRSEIAKLPADRMQGQLLYVLKAMVEGPEHIWIIKDPKTKAGKRVVEFSAEIAAHFTSTNGYLCDLEPNQITRQFERLLKRLDIPHFRFHDLRHYQASILHALGVPDQYIMERGGWETEEVMKRVYRDALPNMTTAAAQIGNAHFTRILGNATGQDEKST